MIFWSTQTVQGSNKNKYLAALRHFLPFAATRVHHLFFFTPALFSGDLLTQSSNISLLTPVSKQ